MSQESSVLSESQEQLGNDPKIEDADTASVNPRDDSKPVLPWDYEDKVIEIKSFSGYKVNFTGWIRRDVRQERQKQVEVTESNMKESDSKATGKKEPGDEDTEAKDFEEEKGDGSET